MNKEKKDLVEMTEDNQEWQKGNESKITSMDRLIYHQEWIKQHHQDIKNKIYLNEKEEDKKAVGFIKD
jgi:hypothetical protein